MYRGLIDVLAFAYGFVCKGRGRMPAEDMESVARGARTLVKHAPAVLGGEEEQPGDRADLAEAGKMADHIDEMVVFLQSMEIC